MNSKFVGDDIVATIETIEAAGAHAAAN
jgi:hypothetical protein